jgi:serine protease Do
MLGDGSGPQPRRRRGRRSLLVALLLPSLVGARATALDTEAVFDRFAGRVFQVRIVEAESGSKRNLGSGFAVSASGHVVTNFHVVAELVHHPGRYKLELVDREGSAHSAELLAFDAVVDLAVLLTESVTEQFFAVRDPSLDLSLEKGTRLYSLGNPYDIGLSVVEGIYNGPLEHSWHDRIHFTGSLNPGMSGGPTLHADGALVGVNVASAGNQVSFLVPVAAVRDLLARVEAPVFRRSDDLASDLRTQLLDHQKRYIAELLAEPFETIRLGQFEAPSRLAPFFSCWGDAEQEEDWLYETSSHQCFTSDRVFVSEEHAFSMVRLSHRQLKSSELGPLRFYELYSNYFELNNSRRMGSENDFTEFLCQTRFVESNGLTLKTAFCARRYRKLDGLFDVVFKAAALGRLDSAFETALVLSGVSFEGAELLTRRYLEAIAWVE